LPTNRGCPLSPNSRVGWSAKLSYNVALRCHFKRHAAREKRIQHQEPTMITDLAMRLASLLVPATLLVAIASFEQPSAFADQGAGNLVALVDGPDSFEQRGDSDKSGGKRSIAGSGHAVRFSVQDAHLKLTGVRIYGSRYGNPQAPQKDFHIWLCDEHMQSLAKFDVPYSKFERGEPQWTHIDLKPTEVPKKYIICVGFDPTQTKGVYVHFDDKPGDGSLTGLPGAEPKEFKEGHWMIRTTLLGD
jgi:hypothetical protein